jgi:hypothetical protein
MLKKILALLILLVMGFSAGLGFWYLSMSEALEEARLAASAEQTVSQNIRELCALLGNIYDSEELQADADDPNNLKITINDRLLFKFGQPVDLDQKYDALLSVLQDLKDDMARVRYIDVSAYRTPAVRIE